MLRCLRSISITVAAVLLRNSIRSGLEQCAHGQPSRDSTLGELELTNLRTINLNKPSHLQILALVMPLKQRQALPWHLKSRWSRGTAQVQRYLCVQHGLNKHVRCAFPLKMRDRSSSMDVSVNGRCPLPWFLFCLRATFEISLGCISIYASVHSYLHYAGVGVGLLYL